MERDNRLKRRRDIEGDENRECHKDKKRAEGIDHDKDKKSYESAVDDDAAFGVFDFPWLKEGAFFALDELLEAHDHDDVFSPFSHLDQIENINNIACEANSSVDRRSCMQDSLVFPKIDDQDSLDYKFDDLESLDCVWSCVIDDQPLDVNICMNNA